MALKEKDMKNSNPKKLSISVFVLNCIFLLVFCGAAHALVFKLEPASLQMCTGCERTVKVYVDGATNLISMGAKVTFDATLVQVVSASKYEALSDGWIMDADGNPATTDDQYTSPPVEIDNQAGSVMMLGGRLTGTSTQGLSGMVLLGEIVFQGVENGDCSLNVDLAKYHPNHPAQTFDNFVTIDKVVDEPTNAQTDLGAICVKIAGDANGDGVVNILDKVLVRNHFGESGPPGWIGADVNCDGVVNILDKVVVRNEFGKSGAGCP